MNNKFYIVFIFSLLIGGSQLLCSYPVDLKGNANYSISLESSKEKNKTTSSEEEQNSKDQTQNKLQFGSLISYSSSNFSLSILDYGSNDFLQEPVVWFATFTQDCFFDFTFFPSLQYYFLAVFTHIIAPNAP